MGGGEGGGGDLFVALAESEHGSQCIGHPLPCVASPQQQEHLCLSRSAWLLRYQLQAAVLTTCITTATRPATTKRFSPPPQTLGRSLATVIARARFPLSPPHLPPPALLPPTHSTGPLIQSCTWRD